MVNDLDLNTLTQLFIRYFDFENEPDRYLVSLCNKPTQEAPERVCVDARYSRNGRNFALDGIRQPGHTQYENPLRLVPDKKTGVLRPLVTPEFKSIETAILRPAMRMAEDHLTALGAISAFDESVTITPQESKPGTHDLIVQFPHDGQMVGSRLLCGRNHLVSLFFDLELSVPTQETMQMFAATFTFSDTEHRQRLPLSICQE